MQEGLNLYFATILHTIAQGLLIPVLLLLVGLILFALFCIGSLIAELFTERRHFKENLPRLINQLHDAPYPQVEALIEHSTLLRPQKAALLMAARNMGLTEDDLFALAKTELAKVDDRYKRILSRTEQVTKIAPMMGLMCTLIPLGPGIVAMGVGQTDVLAQALNIAFDGTVAGLLAAVISLVVTAVRKRWYNQYLLVSESLMTCVLDKATQARAAGVRLPHNYYPEAGSWALTGRRKKPADQPRAVETSQGFAAVAPAAQHGAPHAGGGMRGGAGEGVRGAAGEPGVLWIQPDLSTRVIEAREQSRGA
jgi:biopolymer transport protein ExbB/TolQ